MLLGYLALGARFAVLTPPWQTPDEPAHYNYVSQLRETGDLPVLEVGDYPYTRLEALKAGGFPASESIEGIEYEDYQPPAYYLITATAVERLAPPGSDALRLMRLVSVMLGALTVTLAWAVARRSVLRDGALAVCAAGFVAFVPMHLAMNASANNDPLAYVIMGAMLYASLARATGRTTKRSYIGVAAALYAAALLTKVSLYPAAVVLAAGELAAVWREAGASGQAVVVADLVRGLVRGVVACLSGLVLATPWFVRNASVYGVGDPLGIGRHNELVVEQPRTATWIAEFGFAGWLTRFVTFTHNSFWGVFGWLGVFLDARMYRLLALAGVAAALGASVYLVGSARACRLSDRRRCVAMGLLTLTLLLSLAVYASYNVTFVQHQGRYLFTAMIPIAVLYQLGVRELVRIVMELAPGPERARWLELFAMGAVVLALAGLSWLSLTRYVVPGLS